MKNSYIVITICEGGKFVSSVRPVSHSVNLLSALNIRGIINATICDSKKDAYAIADAWNAGYRRDGTYMYTMEAAQ